MTHDELADRLRALGQVDRLAHMAFTQHLRGTDLDECVMRLAEILSSKCRELELAALDAYVQQPLQPIVMLATEAEIEAVKARLKATT
jgi:hypothetical protein